MVIGVEPGDVSGVDVLDSAKLEAGVAVYTGAGPVWRPDYLEVGNHAVLIVTVEPPRWGDPIYVLRKAFLPNGRNEKPMRLATIYVRHGASTEEATPADMDMLNARMVRQPGTYLDVRVEPVSDRELIGIDDSDEALERYADVQQSLLLSSIRSPQPLAGFSAAAFGEYRTKADFIQEVADWREQLLARLPEALNDRAAERGLAVLDLALVNPTAATFRSVQVELDLPPTVLVCGFLGDLRHQGLPSPPVAYGSGDRTVGRSWDLISSITLPPAAPIIRPVWTPEVRRSDDGVHVTFRPRDSRAQGRIALEDVGLVIGDLHEGSVLVQWEATAHEARERIKGSFELPVAEGRLTPALALAKQDDDSEDA